MVLGGVIAECSACIVHSLQSDVMSLCRRAPGFGGGPRIQGGGFSRVTGWWWVPRVRAVRVRVPRVGVRSGGERSGVCRVQEECSRHGLMGRVPRVQGSGYRVGVQGAAASTQGGVMN